MCFATLIPLTWIGRKWRRWCCASKKHFKSWEMRWMIFGGHDSPTAPTSWPRPPVREKGGSGIAWLVLLHIPRWPCPGSEGAAFPSHVRKRALALFDVPGCTRAAIALIESAVSLRSGGAIAGLARSSSVLRGQCFHPLSPSVQANAQPAQPSHRRRPVRVFLAARATQTRRPRSHPRPPLIAA